MTLTDLKTKLGKYWIFFFFAGFILLFILLYLLLNPSKKEIPPTTPQETSIPKSSQPDSDPFATKPQKYQIGEQISAFTAPEDIFSASIAKTPQDTNKISSFFNFESQNFRELLTDLGTRKVFIDQNRSLTIDDLTITYRSSQTISPQRIPIENIINNAKTALATLSPNPNHTLSSPEFYLSTNQNDQPITTYNSADTVTFYILNKINNIPIATDRTPNLSVGTISLDISGNITSFALVNPNYQTKEKIVFITSQQAINKLLNNQSTITQIKKISGTKTDEEAYYVTNYKTISVDSVEIAYFHPTTKNPETIYPFYIFTGNALSNDGQSYLIQLAVEAVIN